MLNQLQVFLGTSTLICIASMAAIPAAWAETVSTDQRIEEQEPGSNDPTHNQPATTVEEWIAQIEASLVQITGVRIETIETGLQVVLETAEGDLFVPATETVGNALMAEIPNALLALPEGDAFEQFSPAEDIALVNVTNLPDGGVRVSITGTDDPPAVQVSAEGDNLVLSVVPRVASATTEETDAIQVVVTATRTEEDILDVPRSVTIITREELEEQTAITRNLNDILGLLVPGFGPPNQLRATNTQTLRGRTPLMLIDGVPQNTNNRTFRQDLRNIDPFDCGRIEVVRDPSAIYGDGGTGGVINIITRSPAEERLVSRTEIGVNAALGELEGESFGYLLDHSISGREGQFDYTITASLSDVGSFFDAEGNRIPPLGGLSAFDTTSFNILGKVGFNFDDDLQRLELTVDHYQDAQNTNVISDVSVDATDELETTRAIEVGELEFIGTKLPGGRNTLVNLSYSHKDLLNSEVQAQVYYRDNMARSVPFDEREFGFFGILPAIDRTNLESTKWGGRLQVNTPVVRSLSLLWGTDYVNESTSEIIDLFAPETFDATGGRVFEKNGDFIFVPEYNLSSLGLFAQLQWNATDRL